MKIFHRQNNKAQSRNLGQVDIVSALIIVVIAITLVSVVFLYGLPLIQKSQSRTIINRVSNDFDRINTNSLPKKIEEIANSGDEGSFTTFTVVTEGLWILHPYDEESPENNSIYFVFTAKDAEVAPDFGWVPNTCGSSAGLLGTDSPSVLCKRADTLSDTDFNITYKLWFREREEEREDPNSKTYKIGLVKHSSGSLRSTGKSLRIFRGSITTSENLITTEIKILLE